MIGNHPVIQQKCLPLCDDLNSIIPNNNYRYVFKVLAHKSPCRNRRTSIFHELSSEAVMRFVNRNNEILFNCLTCSFDLIETPLILVECPDISDNKPSFTKSSLNSIPYCIL